MVRQGLEIRQAAVDQASRSAQKEVDTALAAQALVDAAATARSRGASASIETERTRKALSGATEKEQTSAKQLGQLRGPSSERWN